MSHLSLTQRGARPPIEVIVRLIDEHRDEFGVEFICRHLQVAPSTYYAAERRQREPSARAVRDATMSPVVHQLWVDNRKVYGAHKVWKAARRGGHDIGRDQVARLMRQMGIHGVSRSRKKVFATRPDPDALRAPDLVERDFTADRPDALWVTDLTYVPTRSGMAYVLVTWNHMLVVQPRAGHSSRWLWGASQETFVAHRGAGEVARRWPVRARGHVAADVG